MPYKDELKRKEAQRERTRRYRSKQKGVTSEGVTQHKAKLLRAVLHNVEVGQKCNAGIVIPEDTTGTVTHAKTEKQFMDAVRDIVKPINFGQPDCMCKHCQYNRTYGNKFTLNHGAWKRVSELGKREFNRVSLPGDVDYVGVAI